MKEEEQIPASETDRNPVSDEKSLDTLENKELEQPHELLEKLPPEQREVAMQFMASFSEFHTRVPAINPLINKFNDDHVHKLLDQVGQQETSAHELRKSNRLFHLVYFLVGVAILIVAVVFLQPRDPELLDTILKYLFAFAGGFGSGATYIVIRDRNR